MKKILTMVALIAGAMCMTNNTAMATETASSVQVMDQQGGYIYKGVLATVYVSSNSNQFTITVPAPSDNITGCAPGSFRLSNNGSTLTITGRLDDIGLYTGAPAGSEAYFEVGGQQSNGDIVVYKIIIIIR